MKLSSLIEKLYLKVYKTVEQIPVIVKPYIRRVIRLCALPYYFLFMIDWSKCNKSKLAVMYDLAYIFFKLKYYPDNYSLCRLWEVERCNWKYYYGSMYDPYQRMRLDREVQKNEFKTIFNDKEICYEMCKAKKIPLPNQFCCLDPNDDYIRIIKEILSSETINTLILKPCIGSGGHGILLAFKRNGNIFINDKDVIYALNEMILKGRFVVQEYMTQHELLANVATSFNTVRIVTLLTKNKEVVIVGAFVRFGIGVAYVDNLSSGGVAVGVNIDDGSLKEKGQDFKCNVYSSHPTSNVTFNNIILPFWFELVELAKDVQKAFPYYRMLGLDIGITPHGPVLVEINPLPDNVALEQSYGPILINEQVRNAFKEYNLLINKSFG